MYGENGAQMRTELAALLRQHRAVQGRDLLPDFLAVARRVFTRSLYLPPHFHSESLSDCCVGSQATPQSFLPGVERKDAMKCLTAMTLAVLVTNGLPVVDVAEHGTPDIRMTPAEITLESSAPYYETRIAIVSAGVPLRWRNETASPHSIRHDGCLGGGICAFQSPALPPSDHFMIAPLPPGRSEEKTAKSPSDENTTRPSSPPELSMSRAIDFPLKRSSLTERR